MAKKEINSNIGEQIKQHLSKNMKWLANQIGMSQGQLSKKINNVQYYKWKQDELDAINKVLGTDFRI